MPGSPPSCARPAPARRASGRLLLAVASLAAPAAAQPSASEWAVYTSMREVHDLTRDDGGVWAATSGGVLRYDEAARTYTRYTRLDGLAGNEVLATAIDGAGHVWFGTNGHGLSRFRPEQNRFDPSFRDFLGRRINVLLTAGDRLYVGTDQGISVFLIGREEVKETYRKLGDLPKDSAVNALALYGGTLFAGTPDGLAWARLSRPNLQDPDSWRSATSFRAVVDLLAAGTAVVAACEMGALVYDPGLNAFLPDYSYEPATAAGLLAGRPVVATPSGNFYQRQGPSNWLRVPAPIIPGVEALSRRGTGLWLGTSAGLRVVRLEEPPPLGEPRGNRFYEMKRVGGDLWVCSTPNDQQESAGLYRLSGTRWTVYDRQAGMPLDELVALETDGEGRLWVGTWGAGAVLRTAAGTWEPITPANSPIRGVPKDPAFAVVSDIQRDGQGNMWMVNALQGLAVMDGYPATQSLLIRQSELGLGPLVDLNRLAIGSDGVKWLSSRTDGLVILDDGGTPFAGGDDHALVVNTAHDGRLSSNRVYDLLLDRDGTLWLATDAGLNAVRGAYDRVSRRLAVDGWRVYTTADGLPTNEIAALALDGDGNLWVATGSGLSQIGRDGEVAFTLTESNSGLASNRVNSLLYDTGAGRMWIGTLDGLSRLELPSRGTQEPTGLRVYPNPFPNTGTGSLTFTGLPLGAALSIYGLDGRLVSRVPGAPGRGSLTWDGLNEAGFLVGSGVYIYVAGTGAGGRVSGRFAVVTGPQP